MPTDFALADLARAEEARLAQGFSEIANESRPFASGIMARAAPGSWANAAVGGGLSGPVSLAQVDELIDFYTSHSIEPRIELCPFADKSLFQHLATRGFVLRNFENVLFRELSPGESFSTPATPPPGMVIRPIDPANEAEVQLHAETAMRGFLPDDFVIPDDMLEVSRRCARHPRICAILVELDGRTAAAGAIEYHNNVAALFGVTVLPFARRRGIQQAMIAWRLDFAARRGIRWATIGTRPGQATERNTRRMGFQVAYTKPTMVRPGPGLEPVKE